MEGSSPTTVLIVALCQTVNIPLAIVLALGPIFSIQSARIVLSFDKRFGCGDPLSGRVLLRKPFFAPLTISWTLKSAGMTLSRTYCYKSCHSYHSICGFVADGLPLLGANVGTGYGALEAGKTVLVAGSAGAVTDASGVGICVLQAWAAAARSTWLVLAATLGWGRTRFGNLLSSLALPRRQGYFEGIQNLKRRLLSDTADLSRRRFW